MADPKAAPPSAISEMGVSSTRSSPYFSQSPGEVLNVPPNSVPRGVVSPPLKWPVSSQTAWTSTAGLTR